jgi:maltoporin
MRSTRLVPLLCALAAGEVSALDFHGYLRSGLGGSSGGGGQVCFQAPGAPFKFRLGNECDNYAELEFVQSLYQDKQGIEFYYDGMLAYDVPAAQVSEPLSGSLAVTQNFVGVKNLPFLGSGTTLWAGKRYFRRHDLHALDFFYLDASGPGAGVDDLVLGSLRLSFSLFQHKVSDLVTYWRPDLRIRSIPLWDGGTLELVLELFVDPSRSGLAGEQRVSPWATAEWRQELLGGFNLLTLQYATGTAAPMKPVVAAGSPSDDQQWRLIEQLIFKPQWLPELSGALTLVYLDRSQPAPAAAPPASAPPFSSDRTLAAGVRPAWQFNDYFKLAGELGLVSNQPKDSSGGPDGRVRHLFKATLAPTVLPLGAPGAGYFTRPELRLFVTFAAWSQAAQLQGIAGQTCPVPGQSDPTNPFGCDRWGLTFGSSVETWF